MANARRTYSILQWNCRGFYANIDHLQDLLHTYDPACVCLQELILGQRSLLSLKNYTASHSTGRGGAGLFIKKCIPSAPIPLRTTLQAVASIIFIGSQYTICSLYIPPHSQIIENDLEELLEQLPRPYLILGDLNCRDPMWGDTTTTFPATMIKNILNKRDLGILNSGEYTHYHRQTNTLSCIDISLCSTECLQDFEWNVKTPSPEIFYESDHFPIIIKRPGQNTYPTGPRRYNFSRANWKEYMNCTILKTPEPATCPNKRVAVLENTMNAAAEKCIPSVNMDSNQQPKIPWWNGLC